MNESHEHDHSVVDIVNVVADAPGARRKQYDYAGIGAELPSFGQLKAMALLVRRCECGHSLAFEYGNRKTMRHLQTQMQLGHRPTAREVAA